MSRRAVLAGAARARLRPGGTPLDVRERFVEAVTVPLRGPPA
jgi:hypothetical protein